MTIGALSVPSATISLKRTPGLVALAVAEPADARGQALERDLLLRLRDPAVERLVVGEELEHGPVGRGDVGGVAGERDPAERALALAEERADVGGHEAGELPRPRVAAELGLGADRVAVVEDLGARVHEAHHRLDVARHRLAGAVGEALRVALGVGVPLLER